MIKAKNPKWQPVSKPPTKPGFYLIHAPSANPKSPLIAMVWYDKRGWSGLVPIWLRAIKHWLPLPKPPRK